jgi:hypothetical protein
VSGCAEPTRAHALSMVDCLMDPRSIALEHWSYNVGVARNMMSHRGPRNLRVLVSADCARLMSDFGIAAEARPEGASLGPRLPRLLAREWRAARLISGALHQGHRVLLLHVHPLALYLALPALRAHGHRLAVCLHNDFIGAVRGSGAESRIERVLWRVATAANAHIAFVAPNRHFARFFRSAMPPGTRCVVMPHPVLDRSDYERVAAASELADGERFDLGFFGRVDPGRGAGDFRSLASDHSQQRFVLAGRWTSRVAPLPNLEVHELPETPDYCALLLRAKSLYLDLRDESYRVGESGVFWDAVGTGARLHCGWLPRLYRRRMQDLVDGDPPDRTSCNGR